MKSDGQAADPGNGFVHQALIYGSDEEFVDVALPFVEDGLRSRQPTLVAVHRRHVKNLREALGGTPDGLTLHPVKESHETSARTRQKLASWVAEHSKAGANGGGGGRVRLMGEPRWALGHEAQVRDWARHEAVVNVAFADRLATFVCPYDGRALPDEILAHAQGTHPEIVDAGGVSTSMSYEDPLTFCRRLDAEVEPQGGPPSIEIGFGLDDLPAVRRAIGSFALDAGLSASRTEEIVLAANEITANAVIHGRQPATVRAWHVDGEIIVEVSDAGEGIRDVLAGQSAPPTDGLGGRGLWLARLLCDAVEVRNEAGCTVSIHASTPRASTPA
jgi:anti-sigma regulatory factor (Ser/Thr protein kinase)